ncbi:hypothetical protein BD414DRAFT_480566 [Trametes punicea]|nr:hypothetical protein BD414DRAFT_480566 [Trametes punicea]
MSNNSCITATHPDVLAYIAHTASSLARVEVDVHRVAKGGECGDVRWHLLSQCTTWWRVEYGGFARPEGVANALGKWGEMSLDEARCVFAVAALAVFNLPAHPAHWAFWARNARQRVAELVHELICERPMRIALPPNVAWIDIEYNLISLRNYQRGWLPEVPRPTGGHGPSAEPENVLKKTRTSARQAARERGAKTEVGALEEQNINGKRAAGDEMSSQGEEHPPKRLKRQTTVAAAADGQTSEATPTKPKERGARVTPPKSPAADRTRSKAGPAQKTANARPASPTTCTVPSADIDVPMDEYNDQQGASMSNAPIPQAAIHKAPLREYRTPRNAAVAKTIFLSSPPSESPRTPAANSSSNPKKLNTRGPRRRPFSVARSDTSEQSVALSATSTLVPSTHASDSCSTREATAVDLDVKDESPLGSRPSPCVPLRSSARIQAKRAWKGLAT